MTRNMYLTGPQTTTNETTCCFDDVCCEPSDFYVVVSDTMWPSEFNCGCGCGFGSYCEYYDGTPTGVNESNLGEFMDERFLQGEAYQGVRILPPS